MISLEDDPAERQAAAEFKVQRNLRLSGSQLDSPTARRFSGSSASTIHFTWLWGLMTARAR